MNQMTWKQSKTETGLLLLERNKKRTARDRRGNYKQTKPTLVWDEQKEWKLIKKIYQNEQKEIKIVKEKFKGNLSSLTST